MSDTHGSAPRPLPPPFGAAIKRKEDERLVVGRGQFVDDLRVPGVAHAAIVRSPYARARIRGIEAGPALALPGVVAVITAADLPNVSDAVPPLVPSPSFRVHRHPALAAGEARHAGEAVAVVVADDPYRAADAADALVVDLEPLPAVVTVDEALAPGAPRVFADWPDNVVGVSAASIGDPGRGFAAAAAVVEAELLIPRVAPMPIEPRGVLARPAGPDLVFTVWTSTQVPYAVRAAVARALGISEERVRVIAPDVGGGFGGKGHCYPEDVLIPLVAARLGRPVKWVESRREHLWSSAPDRDQRHRARIGVGADGAITAIETLFTRDHGAYPMLEDVIGRNTINHLPGPYRVENYRARAVNVVTHKTFSAAYRGAGRPEAAFVLDRLLDRAARAIDMDPAELRRRNLIAPGAMPYATGLTYRDGEPIVYDPADYPAAFDRLLERFEYGRWREEQRRRQDGPRPIGIGLSAYVEGTGIGPFEGADVRVDGQGTVHVLVGVSSQGQAHETTLAQIAAAELSVPVDRVVVIGGDTSVMRHGMGTIASRVAAVAGPAVARSAREVARKARLVAAEILEAAADDVVLEGGHAHVAGVPGRSVPLARVASASVRSRALAREGAPGLHACAFFYPGTVTWAFGAHVGLVEVDAETGAVRVLRYAAVHDCGRPINPMVVEGQLHGGIVQGLGAALMEEIVYDGAGQLLTGTLMEYALPTAGIVPALDVLALDHASMINEVGIKGVGESGIISPPVVIANAVEDAIARRGPGLRTLPVSAERVWEACRAAR